MISKPIECNRCPLSNISQGFIREEGLNSLGVYVMGEAGGGNEAEDGLPFRPYAPAGSVLERSFKRMGLDRSQVRIGNVISCSPPGDKLNGASYEIGAIEHCKVHWETRLRAARPKVILALGNIPLRTLTGMSGKMRTITALRGYVFETPYGLVIPSIHPAFIRRGKPGFTGLFLHDLQKAVHIARNGYTRPAMPKYDCFPGLDVAESFTRMVEDNPNLLVTYDIETRESFGQEEDELEWEDSTEEELDQAEAWEGRNQAIERLGTTMTQIQFSTAPGTAIVFPAEGEYMNFSKRILATQNRKAGQNVYRFDNPILRDKYGFAINGLNLDIRWGYHHIQPDLPANLQSIASVYGFPYPWKHLAQADPGFYGGCDVDAPQYIMATMMTHLEKRGVLRGYMEHVVKFDPVLMNMSRRGILQDPEAKEEFRKELVSEMVKVDGVLQAKAPEVMRSIHPKDGYKQDKAAERDGAVEHGETTYQDHPAIWTRRQFTVGDALEPETVERWCKILRFNPNSSDQLIRYMKAKGHPVPVNRKEQRETTAKKELERLAKKVKDGFYLDVLEYRGLGKMLTTYVDGWVAGRDGRVHSEFGYGPATGQLSSRGPNVQNAPKHRRTTEVDGQASLADKFRMTIVPRKGYRLVELDFKSFHACTLALETGDASYDRMARIDMHSFFAACGVLRIARPELLMDMPDEELTRYFDALKADKKRLYAAGPVSQPFKWIRDKLAKPCILGYGFGMQGGTLYEMNQEFMPSKGFAQGLIDTLDQLYPITSDWRRNICLDVHDGGNRTGRELGGTRNMLVSRHGYLRWFWEVFRWDSRKGGLTSGDDHERVIAFLPANDAFGHYRDALNRLEAIGANDDYRMINNLHDAGLYEVEDGRLEEGIAVIKWEMEKASEVLFHPRLCPGGFQVGVDVQVSETRERGGNWCKKASWNPGGMEDWKAA